MKGSHFDARTRFTVRAILSVLTLATLSCTTATIVWTPRGPTTRQGVTPEFDVALIPIFYNSAGDSFMTPYKTQGLKARREIAIWIIAIDDDASLNITFPGTNPFNGNLNCPGNRFCFALSPSNTPGKYSYDATIQYKGKTYKLDPEVEIWN